MKNTYFRALAILFGVACLFGLLYAFNRFVGIKNFLFLFSNHTHLIRTGDWDEHIREIGNVVLDKTSGKYLLYYSGHRGKNARGKNDIFVGVAESSDMRNWRKLGKVFGEYAEDPYVISCGGYFWMFYEEKSRVPDVSISLARSADGRRFEIFAQDIIVPRAGSFQSRDTSSPVAVCANPGAVVLYEARRTDAIGASVGYAYSPDFIAWEQTDLPVFSLPDGAFTVPQDIAIVNGETYVMTYSNVDEFFSFGRTDWKTKSIESVNLVSWSPSAHVENRHEYSMFLGADMLMTSDASGIYAFPLEEYEWQ